MSISADNIRACEICERVYNHDRLTACPRCKGDKDYLNKRSTNELEQARTKSQQSTLKTCEVCRRDYNNVRLSECPFCAANKKSEIESETTPSGDTNSYLIRELSELIKVQKKTTHATRAVVIILRFFMANLFMVGMWIIFGVSQNFIMILISCLVWIIGAVGTLVRSGNEFSQSE